MQILSINILGIKHSGKTEVSITPDTVLSGEITILALGELIIRRISFRCGGLSIERNQKPLAPKITLAATHHDRQKQVEVKRSSRVNPHEIRLLSGCPYAVVK